MCSHAYVRHRMGRPPDEARLYEWRVTFGQKYVLEPHPRFPEAHPDGWVTILVGGEDEARAIAFRELGRDWSGLYDADDIGHQMFPRGELAVFGP
jgi:hypothetical protein